eukprot:m.46768 g.46768  ORF g.46768 m.46768 type:complete len:100 (+) comp33731_c0_seq1:715-1014(+)
MMATLLLLSYQDNEDPGYNGIVDKMMFTGLVLAVNGLFFVYLAGRFLYALVRAGREVKSKYGKLKFLSLLFHLSSGGKSEAISADNEETEPLLGRSQVN